MVLTQEVQKTLFLLAEQMGEREGEGDANGDRKEVKLREGIKKVV